VPLLLSCRILFSYGRDKLVPCAGWWGTFNHRTRTPQNAVWGATGIAILLGLPMLGSSVAFESLLSLSTIALFVLYAGECENTGITLRAAAVAAAVMPASYSAAFTSLQDSCWCLLLYAAIAAATVHSFCVCSICWVKY
jgi:hypothetical protein